MVLLRCVADLPSDAVQLTLYGTGPDEVPLRALACTLGIEHRVTFAGWVESERIWSEVDILLMPSLHEGAPNAALEALAHGIPVLASDLPEHREILDPSSLVPANDPEAWRRRLEARLKAGPGALAEMAARQAAGAAALRFDWDKALVRLVLREEPRTPATVCDPVARFIGDRRS
jgi:glycosyltransferase involved in cell wall biosynthesis